MKMNKLVIGTVAAATLLTFGAKTGFAAEADNATSKANVKLQQGEKKDPVKPIEPGEPGGETGNVGPLTIDNVTPFNFGMHDIDSATQTYTISAKNANIQVSDRRGEGQGWMLQVGLSAFAEAKDKEKVLKGASLTIPQGQMKTTAGNVSVAPNNFGIKLEADGEGAATLMQADEKTGMGSWADVLNSDEVKLTVPAGNFAGEYNATLSWSLVDAPTK